jgi:hypothetical protein
LEPGSFLPYSKYPATGFFCDQRKKRLVPLVQPQENIPCFGHFVSVEIESANNNSD